MQDCRVERRQYQAFTHSEAKQGSIRHLIVSVYTFNEWFYQGVPVGSDRLKVISRLLLQPFQHGCGLVHAHVAGLRPGKKTEDSGFAERAQRPL